MIVNSLLMNGPMSAEDIEARASLKSNSLKTNLIENKSENLIINAYD